MSEKDKLYLAEPHMTLKSGFLELAADFQNAGERYGRYDLAFIDFERYLSTLDDQRQGRNLAQGHVSMDSYWLARVDGTILGQSHLRHRLTPALEIEGGHIGYAIRPGARRKGFGTLILGLTLEKAYALGLRRVMVTCDSDNIASAKIIEKNDGLYSGQSISPRSGKAVSLYWIEL